MNGNHEPKGTDMTLTRAEDDRLLEIGRELARTNVAPDSERPLPVPDSLGRMLRKRLERLPRETRQVLLVAALAGRPTAALLGRLVSPVRGRLPAGVRDLRAVAG
jgi:hypothetical protein